MKTFDFTPKGVCSRGIHLEVDENNIVTSVRFIGGCAGNTQGVARLSEGRKVDDVIETLKGIRCGMKSTSCPDQLACALEEFKKSL
ncbi:MAG: TIGR03905 family TSCPD domain-containing protein [Clostridia bacterium]|nr:TIGR03905 family TSCPD domain-containing protein [Clostridia bacterium]